MHLSKFITVPGADFSAGQPAFIREVTVFAKSSCLILTYRTVIHFKHFALDNYLITLPFEVSARLDMHAGRTQAREFIDYDLLDRMVLHGRVPPCGEFQNAYH